MSVVKRVPVGRVNCYLVSTGDSFALIDTGYPRKGDTIIKAINGLGIEPDKVDLIIITHAHYDHTGNCAEMREICGAKVVAHESEQEIIENAETTMPAGATALGKFISAIAKKRIEGKRMFDPSPVDIAMEDGELSLHEYGIEGRLIHTPGHSVGCISLLLDTGEAFVGDTVFNFPPIGNLFPPFADDVPTLLASWEKLLQQNPEVLYPGHGAPIGGKKFADLAPGIIEKKRR